VSEHGVRRPRPSRIWAVAIGTVVVAGLAVVSFGTFAGADDTGGSAPATAPDGAPRPHRAPLTDDQKQCLANQGVTLPTKPADGTRPAPPTDAERQALRAAAVACGLAVGDGPGVGGPGGHRPMFTDDQKQCLADHGVTLPTKPADGTPPAPPTDAERQALRAAAEACGIMPPGRPAGTTGGGVTA
jgi:hypothetical protein